MSLLSCRSLERPEPLLNGVRQLVLVRTAGWEAGPGWLRLFERSGETSPWRPVGGEVTVEVGGRGIAWDRGLHGRVGVRLPARQPGDGRVPAGIYPLSRAFGDLPAVRAFAFRVPYRALRSRPAPAAPGGAAPVDAGFLWIPLGLRVEDLRIDPESRDLRRWLASAPGLCGFSREALSLTSALPGVHMPRSVLRAILAWADPESRPAVVVLPEEEFRIHRESWKLPDPEAEAGPQPVGNKPEAGAEPTSPDPRERNRLQLVLVYRGSSWEDGLPALSQKGWISQVQWLRRIRDAGRVLWSGRPADLVHGLRSADLVGIFVLRARDMLEARRLLDQAPGFRSSLLRYECRPFSRW